MTYQKAKEEIIDSSPQKTEAGKEELYLYSLRKMAEENVENNRTGLTNLHNINSFFYLCGEMIKQQPDKKYSVMIMDIVQFKAVNEFCGRDEGDRLLRFIASCFDWYENNRPNSYACHIRAYSTMNMLKNQTLDEIKIDREFIRDLEKDKSRIIIRNTIAMLQQLGVHIVIEGVETEEQKRFLLGCGCTDAQGFLFHRPMPVEAFDALLLQQECESDMEK